jgi:hypothetical protein
MGFRGEFNPLVDVQGFSFILSLATILFRIVSLNKVVENYEHCDQQNIVFSPLL